jgi:hypothetical protein|tara:strand:+ start:648 stop:1481 length:834 start_codon:yes stop_codon:yes gene_type:complete
MEQQYSKTCPRIDKLSMLTSVVALGYVVSRFLETPSRVVKLSFFGSPLHFWIDGQAIMILLVAASVISGTDMMIRSHAEYKGNYSDIRPYYHCIGPVLTVVMIGMLLNSWKAGSAWLVGFLCSMIFLTLVLTTEYRSIRLPAFHTIRIGLLALYYPVVLTWLFWLVNLQVRAAISAIAAMTISGLLCFRLLYGYDLSATRAGWNSFTIGLIIGELMWVMSYLALPPMIVAILLLLVLHISIGIINNISDMVSRVHSLVEYSIVTVIVISAIIMMKIV